MDSAAHLGPGTQINAYRVQERLCEGGMAVLYRVAAIDGSEAGLLKLPKLEFGNHPACYAGFEVEQMILGRVAGPHVPRLLASGESDCGPYLVMEYISGRSLADAAAGAPLPATEVARLGAALASALHDLHRQEVVHHDLKPSHVILRENGQATLIDFGLAFHGHLPDLAEAESAQPLGTAAYISPEQIAGVRGDPRSDVFSVGAILYLLATGRLPFGEPTGMAGLRRRLYVDPLPPRRIIHDLPEWLQEIILHCLEVRTAARYATAAQVAHDLTHPAQVALTERGRRTKRAGPLLVARRWLTALAAPPPVRRMPTAHLAQAPHVLVALDTSGGGEALFQALRDATQRTIGGEQHWRVSCVSVLEPSLLTEQEDGAEIMRGLHLQRLVELHHWAQPLALPQERLRFHVLEGGDVPARLIDYARASHVDHIIIGARGSSGLRRLLGSVSARVAAEAPCTVTVVRAAHAPGMDA
ncbi:MAG: bifunctional serine/threonine-protein kinase/universal stress protein [Sulfuritalea sp.]|nr:bifunctional serine/threonine-protein kinase/universal stress protein [Sulfuritalea sp.]